MLDLLNHHIEEVSKPYVCVVGQWINTLGEEEQKAFAKIKDNNKDIQFAALYSDLSGQTELTFKLTAFRSHFRGYCSCQK